MSGEKRLPGPFTATEALAHEHANIPEMRPHPDGMPWSKCCRSPGDGALGCQCLMRRRAGLFGSDEKLSRFDRSLRDDGTCTYPHFDRLIAESGRFFCMHRMTDDGFYRECAGWAAKMHKKPEDGVR